MLRQRELRDELQSLKRDVARQPETAGESMADAAVSQAEALVEQIKTMLSELEELVGREGEPVRELVADRPLATLASAFALGVVVAFTLRRV